MPGARDPKAGRMLAVSTLAFATCFAAWTIFSIIGVGIKQELGLGDTEFGVLLGTPILIGSATRLLLGIWADRYGGRPVFVLVMLAAASSTFALSFAATYPMILLAAAGIGLAGGTFAVGVTHISHRFPKERQGTALAIFGMGDIGAAATKLLAPLFMIAFGWAMVAQIWAAALAVMAIVYWFTTAGDPVQDGERKRLSLHDQLAPLWDVRVWRFSLYYFFVFGGFVALALWLPRYYVGVYRLDIGTAGALGAGFSIAASLFRVYGGILADRIGARKVMYLSFGASAFCTFLLSYPATDYIVHGIGGDIRFAFGLGPAAFTLLIFALGFFMALGMAAVYRHIPVYYPDQVGPVGGFVSMIGGLGGFILPIAFGLMADITGLWTSCFMLLFLIVTVNLAWMHRAILAMERATAAHDRRFLAELQPHGALLTEWEPEDARFWETAGRRIANRNLWISIPALLLAFAVWMVWSAVVVNLPLVGFKFSTDQLFWLAALPGLSGTVLRGFYAFMVPIFGGRTWTTFATASLLAPAIGIGLAVQNPATPYAVFLVLALLCGLGGGNFASSMANISFFFPKAQKGMALGLNAGLGNLGVSAVQFVVPLVITAGMFGALGGAPQALASGKEIWLQNAGFVWVPMILAATAAAWFGMNDVGTAKASLADQAAIFRNRHTWLLCWLYTGVFGSFIGYAAGFPLLTKTLFPGIDPMAYAFLGPLIGAAARSLTGWMADRWGGARITIVVFLAMMAAAAGVLFFIAHRQEPDAFRGFLAMFLLLFAVSGVGNASVFQMVPAIFRTLLLREAAGKGEEALAKAQRDSGTQAAAVLGFTSAVAAAGAFFIPKSFGTAIALTGSPSVALIGFMIFYLTCLGITWWFYARRDAKLRVWGAVGATATAANR